MSQERRMERGHGGQRPYKQLTNIKMLASCIIFLTSEADWTLSCPKKDEWTDDGTVTHPLEEMILKESLSVFRMGEERQIFQSYNLRLGFNYINIPKL